jgi:hypothetical protein
VATTARNIDKTARTVRQMAEVQRDSYEAIAENLAAAQRRSIGLAEGGLEFMRLQEENARAAQEFFANGVRLLQLQGRNAEFVQGWMGEAVEVLREQTEQNVRTAEAFGRTLSKQQEGFRALTQGWVGAYRDFFSPFAYFQEGIRTFQRATQQGLEATEQVARQGLRATEQATRQGLRVAEEATEQTEEVLRQTEKVTREAELRSAVLAALQTTDYEGLTVAEVTERLDDLSVEQLEQLREFEKNHKNRETLIDRIDSKIRANNS